MEIIKKIAQQGYFQMLMDRPAKYCTSKKLFGLEIEKLDFFHHQIVGAELIRAAGMASIWAAMSTGTGVGLSPVIKFGSE